MSENYEEHIPHDDETVLHEKKIGKPGAHIHKIMDEAMDKAMEAAREKDEEKAPENEKADQPIDKDSS